MSKETVQKTIIILLAILLAVGLIVLNVKEYTMTEGSMPWNDQEGGDGNTGALLESPYSSTEWHVFWNALVSGEGGIGYVIPEIGNEMEVTERGAGASMSVDVESGEVLVNGVRYKNTGTENLTITTADATNDRIDRVIIRITYAAQTARLAVLDGTPASPPSAPALTQNTTTWEVELGQVYVPANDTSVTDRDIHDKRTFAPNYEFGPYVGQDNLFINSEFIAWSELTRSGGAAEAPERWYETGTIASWTEDTIPSQMSRGRAPQFTTGANDSGMQIQFRVPPSSMIAIKGLIKVTSGDVGRITISTDGTSPDTLTRTMRLTGSWVEEKLYYQTVSDATTMTLLIEAASSGDVISVGQFIAQVGYETGPYRQFHEYIPADKRRWEDANHLADALTASTWYTVDLSTEFGGFTEWDLQGVSFLYQTGDPSSNSPQMTISPQQVLTDAPFNAITQVAGQSIIITGSIGLDDGYKFYYQPDANCDVNFLFLTGIYT